MTDSEVLDLFRQSGALLEGHFRLSSGLHSDRYLQSALVLQHPDLAEHLGREIAFRTAHLEPTAVLSPALGGIVIGQEVGRALHVRAIFAERQDGVLMLRRGHPQRPHRLPLSHRRRGRGWGHRLHAGVQARAEHHPRTDLSRGKAVGASDLIGRRQWTNRPRRLRGNRGAPNC